ncbi:hypothetical protein B0H19DRAFT_1166147 [Mycena capillaripes]|nr:hypothetical protein B0H19DRAFT_1166147 [Mycena capillaripes]
MSLCKVCVVYLPGFIEHPGWLSSSSHGYIRVDASSQRYYYWTRAKSRYTSTAARPFALARYWPDPYARDFRIVLRMEDSRTQASIAAPNFRRRPDFLFRDWH